MALRCSANLATRLKGSHSSNIDWSTTLINAMGSTRNITAKWLANAASSQDTVWSTGTIFRQGTMTGAMTMASGVVTNYGTIATMTTQVAQSLATGIATLRIENTADTTYWVEGTLGLNGSGADFTLWTNPTDTNGFAVASTMAITPPPFLPSGTGYPPPALDTNAPDHLVVWNYTNEASPVQAGTIPFDTRIANWVFDDPDQQAALGDIRVTQSSASVALGQFAVGGMLLSMANQVNATNNTLPLHQVLVAFQPNSTNWPGYPTQTGSSSGGYQRSTRNIGSRTGVSYGVSNTFMPPFKIDICNAAGTVLYTFDMPYDHAPINSATLSDVATASKPIRPHMHCAQMLMWQSGTPVQATKGAHWFPGVAPEFLRPSISKAGAAFNAANPMWNTQGQTNTMGHWFAGPKWPLRVLAADFTAEDTTRTTNDPYLFYIGPSNAYNSPYKTPGWAQTFFNVASGDMGSLTYGYACIQGWGYEPGSFSFHDMYTGPGGIRIDRAAIPSPIALHWTNPAAVHMRDNTPIATMIVEWNKAYFNHAIHHIQGDIRQFSTIPVSEVMAGQWCYGNVYYNGANTLTTLDKTIPMFAVGASPTDRADEPHWGAFTDSNYRMPWNGYSVDWFHNYTCPGWVGLLYNSPAHIVSQKFREIASILAQSSARDPAQGAFDYKVRDQAWRWLHHAMMWKLGSQHPLGISKATIEARMSAELEAIYTNLYLPIRVNNVQTMNIRSLRNLGLSTTYFTGYSAWGPMSFTLHYYMAHVLQFWRQSGFWDKMWNYSDHCQKALQLELDMLDLGCIDYYLDTDGCYSGSVYNAGVNLWVGDRTINSDSVEIATSWADWLARVNPKDSAVEDLVHDSLGNLRKPDIGEYSRMQWPFIRRDYFSDFPSARDINGCCAKVQGWMDAWTNYINGLETGGTAKRSIGDADLSGHPALGRILPPGYVGP